MEHHLPERRFGKHSPLSETDWRQFFEDGYCLIRHMLSADEVTLVEASLHHLIEVAEQRAAFMGRHFEGYFYYRGAQFVVENDAYGHLEKLCRVCGCGSADPTLLQMSQHPKLLQAFADILMSERFEHLICQFHPKQQGDNVTFPPHRDVEHRLNADPNWSDINHWGSYVVAVIAIDPAGPDNGGLNVVPGSHQQVKLPGLQPARNQPDPQWSERAVCPELAPGDVLLMHPYLVHWSNANTGSHPRFSLLSGVSSPGANHNSYPGECTNRMLTAPGL